MPTTSNRSGGSPNESIQIANALGKLVIGTSSTPATPNDQPATGSDPSAASAGQGASASSSALKQIPALAQSALAAAGSAQNTSQPPIGNWSPAGSELASALENARNVQAAGPGQNPAIIPGGS